MQPYLTLLAMLPVSYCAADFTGMLVPLKKGKLFPLSFVLVSSLIWLYNNAVLPHPEVFWDSVNSLSLFLLLFCFTPKGHRFQGFLVQTFLFLTMMMGNFVALVIFPPIFYGLGYAPEALMDRQNMVNTIICLMATIIVCPMLYGCVRLLRRKMPALNSSSGLSVFLIIPLSQGLLINSLMQYAYAYMKYWTVPRLPPDVILVMLVSLGADIAFLLLYQKFHRDELVQLSARQAEKQLDLQNQYYTQMQERILSVNQIRHDLNNQLQAAYHLLHQGQPEQAKQQLDLIRDALHQRVGTTYCENMMVDAVLCEKAALCQQQDISLELSVFLPAGLPIENAHLCSLFANLLDNAIAAVQSLEQKQITLRAELQGSRLTVFCRNPANAPRKKAAKKDILRKHGLGLEIISRIAGIYSGHMDTEYESGCFEVTVWLQLPSPKK